MKRGGGEQSLPQDEGAKRGGGLLEEPQRAHEKRRKRWAAAEPYTGVGLRDSAGCASLESTPTDGRTDEVQYTVLLMSLACACLVG